MASISTYSVSSYIISLWLSSSSVGVVVVIVIVVVVVDVVLITIIIIIVIIMKNSCRHSVVVAKIFLIAKQPL
uniref:Uncharacterized protein n=1 Tax=Octopus bimaculoides TaxID=37653 RepID=A0A0L8HNT6_OCTBM